MVGVFVFILGRLSLPSFFNQVRSLDFRFIILGVAISVAALGIVSLRLKIVLDVIAPGIPLLSLFAFNLVGLFYSQFLPGSITGDLVKGYYLARTQTDRVGIFSAMLVDRFLGIFLNGLLGVIALMSNPLVLETVGLDARAPVFMLALATIGLIGGYILLPILGHWQHSMPSPVASAYRSIQVYQQHPIALIKASGINFAFYLIWSVGFWCLALSVGLRILDYASILLILAVVSLAQLIPLSINGWGVREGALIVLLSAYGVASEQALLLSLLVAGVNLAIAAFGGIVVLADYRYVRDHGKAVEEKTWT